MRIRKMVFAVLMTVFAAGTLQAQPSQEIEIVFDASRSMNDLMGARTKLDEAKDSLVTVAGQITNDARVGLRVFGATPVLGNVRESCFDSKLLVPIGPLSKARLVSQVEPFQANGQTALGYSLELAGKDFNTAAEVKKVIILISDGQESCGKNPVAVVKNLQAQGIDVKVHAIGFGVDDKTKAQLQEIAQLSGGSYHDAANAKELKQSLQQVAQKENILQPGTTVAAPPAAAKPAEDEAAKEQLLRAQRGKGKNILAATEGTHIESATYEEMAALIDGNESGSTYGEGDQIVLSFKDRQAYLLEGFAVPVIEKDDSNPGLILLSGSMDSPDRGFFPIANFKLKDHLDFNSVDQVLDIKPPVAVRFLKINLGPSVSGGNPYLSELKAFGKPLTDAELKEQLSKQTEKERNIIAKDAGGHMIGGSDSSMANIIDGSGTLMGDAASLDPGNEAVFGFDGDQTAYISKMAVPIMETIDTNCKTFEVSASNESPTAGFGAVQSFSTANMVFPNQVYQEFKLNPVLKGKYLKIRIAETHGASYCYLPEVQAIGTFSQPAGFTEAAPVPASTAPVAPPAAAQPPLVSASEVKDQEPEEKPAEEPAPAADEGSKEEADSGENE